MNEDASMVVVVVCFAFSFLFFKASRIVENWKQDVRRPFLSGFIGKIFARLRLHFFAWHSDVVVCLIYVLASFDMFLDGFNELLKI